MPSTRLDVLQRHLEGRNLLRDVDPGSSLRREPTSAHAIRWAETGRH